MSGDHPETRDKTEKQEINRQVKRSEDPDIDKPLPDRPGERSYSTDSDISSEVDKPLPDRPGERSYSTDSDISSDSHDASISSVSDDSTLYDSPQLPRAR